MWNYFKNPKPVKIELKDFTGHSRDYPEDNHDVDLSDFVIIPQMKEPEQLLDTESKERLAELIAGLKETDLSKINNEDEFVDFVVGFASERGMKVDAEGIRAYFKDSNELSQMFATKENSGWSKKEWGMRLGLTAAGILATYWMAPAYAAIGARAAYTGAYSAIWGIPSYWSPLYWAAYLPGKEYVGHLAYQYSPAVLSTIGLPVFHRGVDAANYIGSGISHGISSAYNWLTSSNQKQAPAKPKVNTKDNDVSPKIETDFAQIAKQLEALSLDEESKQPHFFTKEALLAPTPSNAELLDKLFEVEPEPVKVEKPKTQAALSNSLLPQYTAQTFKRAAQPVRKELNLERAEQDPLGAIASPQLVLAN